MEYLVPFSAFVILIVSSWHWVWNKEKKRPTLRGFLICIFGVIALFLGWGKITSDTRENRVLLSSIKREGLRLLPSDFQVKLAVWAHGVALVKQETEYNPPERVDLNMKVGSISVTGDFVLRPKPESDYKGSRSPVMFWDYYAVDLFVEGLDKIKYLEQLEGENIQLYIPRRAFGLPFMSKLAWIKAYISIKGRVFEVERKETTSGTVEIKITKDQLGLE